MILTVLNAELAFKVGGNSVLWCKGLKKNCYIENEGVVSLTVLFYEASNVELS
jgi:hypothetical protein